MAKILNGLLIIMALFILTPLYSQDMGEIAFINELADKKTSEYGDAVKFLILLSDKKSNGFKADLHVLQKKAIVKGPGYAQNTPLRYGTLALMIANYLKLDDSLLFKIFRIRRYAFTACVANDIMDYSRNEWDIASGGELVEIMAKVSEMSGGNK